MNRVNRRKGWAFAAEVGHLIACAFLIGCEASHPVPAHPTWSDVEPILRAECLHCHGGGARLTASSGSAVYRFDFYDLDPEACGEAATAIDLPTLGAGWATLMATAITSVNPAVRPRMPPAPAPSLASWEWQTILGWTSDPQKGPPPPGNRPPTVRLTNEVTSTDKRLPLSLVVEDPDGESAVGILTIGDFKLLLDRPGAFVSSVDTSAWPAGEVAVKAVVCDGWTNATYVLGTVSVKHQ